MISAIVRFFKDAFYYLSEVTYLRKFIKKKAILRHLDLPVQDESTSLNCDAAILDDVLSAFERLRPHGDALAAKVDGAISYFHYSGNKFNRAGYNNHFQGVKRLRTGPYLVVSGGDESRKMAHLFIIKMGTCAPQGFWRSNVLTRKTPPDEDRIAAVLDVDAIYWHAGGMDTCGDILVVPLETMVGETSKIVFYSMANPEKPARFPFEVVRPHGKGGAVAFTRLPNKRYLLAVWSDSDALPPRLEIYLSRTTNLFDSFPQEFAVWERTNVAFAEGQRDDFGNFQALNFIRQKDGRLFLLGMHNTSGAAPIKPGDNWADLYEVIFPAESLANSSVPPIPQVIKVASKMFDHGFKQYNFDASGGCFIGQQNEMALYATYHWKVDDQIKICEFSQASTAVSGPSATGSGWIELFEDKQFRGRMVRIYQDGPSHFANYKKVYAAGKAFDDKVSSVRFQLPSGVLYRLYRDRDFSGAHFDLVGDGTVHEIGDLHAAGFGDKLSSSRIVEEAE